MTNRLLLAVSSRLASLNSINADSPRRETGAKAIVDRAWVNLWSKRYMDDDAAAAERLLLAEVGEAVRKRGWYTKAELIRVGEWKARGRIRGRLARNSEGDVKEITRSAFAAPEDQQHPATWWTCAVAAGRAVRRLKCSLWTAPGTSGGLMTARR